jgi:SAM-dependent methyltransferase
MAYAHLTGHSDFVRLAAPAVLEHLQNIRTGLVVDLGCGTGILVGELRDAGYEAMGVDLSPDMIEFACRAVPDAEFVVGSFFDAELPECAAVTCIGQSFGYAFDSRNSLEELSRLFERIHQALRPGGLLLFDLNAPAGDLDEVFTRDTPEWTLMVTTTSDDSSLTREITLFRKIGETYRRTDEQHVVLRHEPADVVARLEKAGFGVTTFDNYSGTYFPPGLVGYRAIKS